MRRAVASLAVAAIAALLPTAAPAHADPGIDPSSVVATVFPGESTTVNKTVGTPALPPKLDVCLLEDETGSYADDISSLQGAAGDIYDTVVASAPDSQFGVSGFRDYGEAWVYRQVEPLDPDRADWITGVNGLTAANGGDIPEAQYDAIVSAAIGRPFGPDCGWRSDPLVTRVLLVSTDAPFHVPADGPQYQNDQNSTKAALLGADITLIGLKAPGAGTELDGLAAATGGSVQALSSNGAEIATAILAGLSNLPIEVALTSNCTAPISTSFAPLTRTVTSGDDATFVETISVAAGAAGGTYTCSDAVTFNGVAADPPLTESKTINVPGITLTPPKATNELTAGASHMVTATVTAGDAGPVAGVRIEFAITAGPNAGLTGTGTTDANGQATFTWSPGAIDPAHLGTDTVVATFTNADGSVRYGSATARKTWVDTTPPAATCAEGPNPGGKIPASPGNGGQAQNPDGFYTLNGVDEVWPASSLSVYVVDNGSGTVFGPFAVGTNIKYTQAPGGTPSQKPMSGVVAWHITGTGDATIQVVDGSGNVGTATCLVPPKPK